MDRVSIPEALTENLPEIILDIINTTKDVIMVDNLAAPVVEKVNLVSIRSKNQKINITNILNYY